VEIILCGAIDDADLASLYRRASVVALPSTHEGFGLTALEAMASAAPLVATVAGNLPDLTAGVATLVPPGDPAAFAAAVEAALRDPVQNARMRHAGIARAAEYSWARTAELTADVYREVALQAGSSACRR
jgi:glycosyltransferase involved in cell wall biosynthesis